MTDTTTTQTPVAAAVDAAVQPNPVPVAPVQDKPAKPNRKARRQAAVKWLPRFTALHATPLPYDRPDTSQQGVLMHALLKAGQTGMSGLDMVRAVSAVSRHPLVSMVASLLDDKGCLPASDKRLTQAQRDKAVTGYWRPDSKATRADALYQASRYLASYLVKSWVGQRGYGVDATDPKPSPTTRYRLTVAKGAKGDVKGLARRS